MDTKATKIEIENQIGRIMDLKDENENPYWGMTYLDGVEAALRWVLDGGEPPVED